MMNGHGVSPGDGEFSGKLQLAILGSRMVQMQLHAEANGLENDYTFYCKIIVHCFYYYSLGKLVVPLHSYKNAENYSIKYLTIVISIWLYQYY